MSEVKSCPFRKSGTYISIDDYRKKNGCLGFDLESTECCADCIVPEIWEADVAPVIRRITSMCSIIARIVGQRSRRHSHEHQALRNLRQAADRRER